MKTPITPALIVTLTLLFSNALAVLPPPDGSYPGGNTAERQAALFSLTTGQFNTGVGVFSLRSNTVTSFNTAIGAAALLSNTAEQNTAAGAAALLSNTTGAGNTGTGALALFSNSTGSGNTALGQNALFGNTEGGVNTAVGVSALTIGSVSRSSRILKKRTRVSSGVVGACGVGMELKRSMTTAQVTIMWPSSITRSSITRTPLKTNS